MNVLKLNNVKNIQYNIDMITITYTNIKLYPEMYTSLFVSTKFNGKRKFNNTDIAAIITIAF